MIVAQVYLMSWTATREDVTGTDRGICEGELVLQAFFEAQKVVETFGREE